MPYYLFENAKTGEVREIFFHMKDDEKIYNGDEGDEVGLWKRIYTVSQIASTSQKIDPFSAKDFVASTTNKKETVGSLWDRAAEASAKRQEKLGYDPIKQKYYDQYAKERKGHRHPREMKEKQEKIKKEVNKSLKKIGVEIS